VPQLQKCTDRDRRQETGQAAIQSCWQQHVSLTAVGWRL
jgi:hypothetical protein